MSDVVVTIRPDQRTEIENLPYEGRGAGYTTLGDMIGASRRGQVEYSASTRTWSVSRAHSNKVILGLAERYGRVKVIQYGGVDKCVEACWRGNPKTAWQCKCSCAGRNPGSGSALKVTVGGAGGAGGALSVQASPPREFYVP